MELDTSKLFVAANAVKCKGGCAQYTVLCVVCPIRTFFCFQAFLLGSFHLLDIYTVLHNIPCIVNIRFYQQISSRPLLSAKTFSLLVRTWQTKLDIRPTTYTAVHHRPYKIFKRMNIIVRKWIGAKAGQKTHKTGQKRRLCTATFRRKALCFLRFIA